jgi:hypothetical protein
MPFTSDADFIEALEAQPAQISPMGFGLGQSTPDFGRPASTSTGGTSVPGVGGALDNTHGFSFFYPQAQLGTSAKKRVIASVSGATTKIGNLTNYATRVMLVDRLSHMSGLSGTDATEQTTNLPTAALPRYTDGVGVLMAAEIWTQIGTTAQTLTVSYTNSAGVSGRTSKAVIFGSSGNREAGHVAILPFQDGDSGVRSIESATLSGSTGVLGNFGLVLFKPLMMFTCHAAAVPHLAREINGLIGGAFMPEIKNGCCLSGFSFSNRQNTSTLMSSQIRIIEVPD